MGVLVTELQEQQSALLSLPFEIRLLIYKHLFGVTRPHLRIDISRYDFQFYKTPDRGSILLTCRKCYDEARPLYHTSLNCLVINLEQLPYGTSSFSSSNQPPRYHEVYTSSLYQSAPYTTLNTIFYSPPRRALLHKVTHLTIPFLRPVSLHNLLALTLLPAVQTMELVLTHTTILETADTQAASLGTLPRVHVVSKFWPFGHITSTKNKMPGEIYGLTLFTVLSSLSRNGIQMRWTAKVRWSMLCENPEYTSSDLMIIQEEEEEGEKPRHCIDYVYTHEFRTEKLISLHKALTPHLMQLMVPETPTVCGCEGKVQSTLLQHFGQDGYDMLNRDASAPPSLYYYEED
ncbi:hypothetical protein H2198_004533 [Neophaeococcomyces mojaviensis]|uniref:Uncharacterized protein n=1 Tax=Neophaeococcomyces mojaviensis TaxID=3383035 RepID=A0ACC3A8F5_9EURO|nr:hypothetical protein H2198_004533 [Knufia sp. JES_112]